MKITTIQGLATALLLSTSAVIGLSGCAGDKYNQSTGEHIDDAATSSRVKDSLSSDSEYKYPDVKVSTFKGTVQLSGWVDTHEQKSKAADLAKNTAGVKDVDNNITVKD
jgi:hyperosmotically inducible protein